MFFKRDSLSGQDLDQIKVGRIYVMEFTLECGTILHKIGKSSGKSSKNRMLDIVDSFFNTYRYTPMVRIRLDMETITPLLVEKHIHRLLAEYSCGFEKKFNGSTEFFYEIDSKEVINYLREFPYNELLQVDEMNQDDYEAIAAHLRAIRDSKEPGSDELPF